jgi:hypothetical protein
VVDVPCFLVDLCQALDQHLETEGLFRKAGSAVRQKEIKVLILQYILYTCNFLFVHHKYIEYILLQYIIIIFYVQVHIEAGGGVSNDFHEVDVANILKLFLRELPEPLLPIQYHDVLVRYRI